MKKLSGLESMSYNVNSKWQNSIWISDLGQTFRNRIGSREANKSKRVPNTIGDKSKPVNGGGGLEVLLCLFGKYSSCTPNYF